MKKLVLAGTGIKSISHLTVEAQAYIRAADKVLYLSNEPVMTSWIVKNSKNSESLEKIYFLNSNRYESYNEITNKVFSDFEQYNFICLVVYGHPTVFCKPGIDSISIAQKKGIETLVLPAVSAEDCLYADLCIDPGKNGCYSIEAMSFILYDVIFDKCSDLIIWQVGMAGNLSPTFKNSNLSWIHLIQDKLLLFYPKEHPLILYEASLYPGIKPKIKSVEIGSLSKEIVTSLTTIYICALHEKKINTNLLLQTGLTLEDLQDK